MIEQAIRARLIADNAVAAIVGDRVYAYHAPQQDRFPRITIVVTDSTPVGAHNVEATLFISNVEVQCRASKARQDQAMDEVLDLANKALIALENVRGVIGNDEVQAFIIQGRTVNPEESLFESDQRVQLVTLQFLAHHRAA